MKRQQGFVLIATCIALAVVLGVASLLVDAGRLYVVRSELQAFADSAALSSALELDGTAAGLKRAREAADAVGAGEHAMKWDLGTKSVDDIDLSFNGADPAEVRSVRVAVSVPVSLTLMPMQQVRAASEAARGDDGAAARLIE